MRLRPTTAPDLDYVLGLEAHPDAAPFIERWSRERHELAVSSEDAAHLMVVDGERALGS